MSVWRGLDGNPRLKSVYEDNECTYEYEATLHVFVLETDVIEDFPAQW